MSDWQDDLYERYLQERAMFVEHLKALIDMYEAFADYPDIRADIGRALLKATSRFTGMTLRVDDNNEVKIYTDKELTPKEHELAKAGQKIPAIKEIRARTGLGLKEAKDLYERFYP